MVGDRQALVPGRRLAIMQPYLFPYLGYYQLVGAVDRFVVYDDVNYIKQGWINRNRILLNGAAHTFTMPVSGSGSFTAINDVGLGREYIQWRGKFFRTLEQGYKKAPCFEAAMGIVERVLDPRAERLVDLLVSGIETVMQYAGVPCELVRASEVHGDREGSGGQDRILRICAREQARHYINPIGGAELYDAKVFKAQGIDLWFIKNEAADYVQFADAFVGGLSVLDALMFVPPEQLKESFGSYALITTRDI